MNLICNSTYPWHVNLISFGVASGTSTVLFFGGTWVDGGWGFVIGMIVFIINSISSLYRGLPGTVLYILHMHPPLVFSCKTYTTYTSIYYSHATHIFPKYQSKYPHTEIECFITSFILAMITSFLDKYVYKDGLCLYGILFGGVVWLLPGVTITVSLIELYSKMITFGSTKLIYGISLASQVTHIVSRKEEEENLTN